MIIIAGAIILSLSESNVIDQAETAVQKHNEASEKDVLTLAWGEYMASSIRNPAAELKVEGAIVTGDNTNGWTVTFTSGSKYLVSSKGVITKDGVQEGPEIDDEKVEGIINTMLNTCYSGSYDDEEDEVELKQLKQELLQELHINSASNGISDFAISINTITDETGDTGLIYFYELDRIYLWDWNTYEVRYVNETSNPVDYELARKLELVKTEIDSYIVGKTSEQLITECENNTLASNIMKNSENIKELKFRVKSGEILTETLVIEISTGEYDMEGFFDTYFENDICTGSSVVAGH